MPKHSGNDFAGKIASTPGYKALRNAQALVVISSPKIHDPNAFTMANASCAAENMLLEATELGIGSRFQEDALHLGTFRGTVYITGFISDIPAKLIAM